jgi:hypothetical protein
VHIEVTEAKAFGTFITIYSVFKGERLSAHIEVTVHKSLFTSEVSYACLACQLSANTYLLNLQRLQNTLPRTTGNFPRCPPVGDFHKVFSLTHVKN